MTVDLPGADQFVYRHARLLDRHRWAVLRDEPAQRLVVDAVVAYQNDDGGFGHALEPDVRDPASQPAATLTGLDVLAGLDAAAVPRSAVVRAHDWLAAVALPDGSAPFVLPSADAHPRAPWMTADDAPSFLTFSLVAALLRLGHDGDWVRTATRWCWQRVAAPDALDHYWVKHALAFLDAVPDDGPDDARARDTVESLRDRIAADGSVPVPGGVEDERLTALDLSPRPGARSRVLFADDVVAAALDELARGQRDDGGWDFDFLHWSPAQELEWRGRVTVDAVATLTAHDRLPAP
ncbi:hypothetical protein SAMN05443575_0897 [Jatrophihabitans endophyticus]|uniref:Prenyltransferase and squalene oxidase repeat-containing protein n=1 Tax=Jatrophihabitans endophyticus TaxID=1206085 RepID=A0A1M5EHG3_9ACTN|nr:hypothetical protein [Jatrophihabitans endophyticus]SHF78685.1 hypothetical protein SAMN05443575_0897 [Jatrophihabitans endophyticus]